MIYHHLQIRYGYKDIKVLSAPVIVHSRVYNHSEKKSLPRDSTNDSFIAHQITAQSDKTTAPSDLISLSTYHSSELASATIWSSRPPSKRTPRDIASEIAINSNSSTPIHITGS